MRRLGPQTLPQPTQTGETGPFYVGVNRARAATDFPTLSAGDVEYNIPAMNCLSSGSTNFQRSKFRTSCDTTSAARCAIFETGLASAVKFRGECCVGSATPVASAERSARSYMPKHLADEVVGSKFELEGEAEPLNRQLAS